MMNAKDISKGLLVVVSAPSGSGKTSILGEFFRVQPGAVFSVSVTTRSPREGERHGVDYFFVTEEEFDRYIENDEFAEWAVVHDNRYGTLKKTIDEALENGRTIVLDTDTVGAFHIREKYPGAVLIFILPPSLEELEERLRLRSTESAESLSRRLQAVPFEVSRMPEYDYVVVNDALSVAVSRICSIIEAERSRTERILPTLTSWREYIDGSEEHRNRL